VIAGWPGSADSIQSALDYDGEPPEWHSRAACVGMAYEDADRADSLFFPEPGAVLSNEARALCGGCPVSNDCYIAGLREAGVWGGVQANERTRIRIRASRAA
jgi:hypothetical protein